jgi:hypothetical protein
MCTQVNFVWAVEYELEIQETKSSVRDINLQMTKTRDNLSTGKNRT